VYLDGRGRRRWQREEGMGRRKTPNKVDEEGGGRGLEIGINSQSKIGKSEPRKQVKGG
jgi:hypothetical protein